jgi:hypothetical protein
MAVEMMVTERRVSVGPLASALLWARREGPGRDGDRAV